MRTVVHLSDLHFGRLDPALLAPLRRRVTELRADVLVVSGDLTQRARPEQFRAARHFLDALPVPQVVVPGNHDVPLYNVFQRFFTPLGKFHRYISEQEEPAFIDEEIAVVGVNTARSLAFKGGRVNKAQVERVRSQLCGLDDRMIKIVVTHHPFDLPAQHTDRALVRRAPMAMQTFARCGADILLSGHLHVSSAGDTSSRYRIDGLSALVVQAGTATSTRGRGESNSFNALLLGPDQVRIERFAWNPDIGEFALSGSAAFARRNRRWAEIGTAEPVGDGESKK